MKRKIKFRGKDIETGGGYVETSFSELVICQALYMLTSITAKFVMASALSNVKRLGSLPEDLTRTAMRYMRVTS